MKDVSFPFFHSRDRSVAATFIIDRNSCEKNSYVDLVDCSSLRVLYQGNFFFFCKQCFLLELMPR
jgi:hypothetical protein